MVPFVQLCPDSLFRRKGRTLFATAPEHVRKKERAAPGIADDNIFRAIDRTDGGEAKQSRARRGLQSKRGRNRNPHTRVRSGAKAHDNHLWRSTVLMKRAQAVVKITGMLAVGRKL